MDKYGDAHMRSIIKALSWRVFASITTMLIVFLFTRKVVLSIGVGLVEIVTKLILYYFHERIWLLIPFGKKKHPLLSIPVKESLNEDDFEVIKTKLEELGYIEGR